MGLLLSRRGHSLNIIEVGQNKSEAHIVSCYASGYEI